MLLITNHFSLTASIKNFLKLISRVTNCLPNPIAVIVSGVFNRNVTAMPATIPEAGFCWKKDEK